MLRKITISYTKKDGKTEGAYTAYTDVNANSRGRLVFLSMVMQDSSARSFIHDFKEGHFRTYFDGAYASFESGNTTMESQKVKGGYHHFILRARVESGKHTRVDSYIFRKEGSGAFYPNDSFSEVPQDIVDKVSECIMEHTSIPFIKEWGRYVCRHAMSRNNFEDVYLNGANETEADYGVRSIVRFSMSAGEVERDIRNGLANHTISIDGCKSSSDTFKDTEGLNDYLDNFGTALATQTTKTFHPAFDPSKEEISKKVNDFYDLCEFYVPEVVPYKKQKHVIEAGSRCLKDKNSFLISGEPGAGKTIMAIGTVATSAWRPDYSVVCMVPPGLVTRWEDAITKTVPMSDVRIITDMKGFLAAAKELKNPLRMRSLWVIMSNNVVKADFAMHPSVIWSEDRHCYVCPHCGRPVVVRKMRFDGEEDNRRTGEEMATAEDFLREPAENKIKNKNLRCERVIGPDGKAIDGCGAKLWTAATKDNASGICRSTLWKHPDDAGKSWTKIPNLGWIQRNRIEGFKNDMENLLDSYDAANLPKKVVDKMNKALKAIADFETRGATTSYPQRYSIARYLKQHMNKAFDFGIFDEVHQLTGDSLQGKAFADITNGVKKSIFLTGTLSKGYPKDMFYLLFRTQTRKMIEDGFSYDSHKEFDEKYGVKQRTVHEEGSLITTYRGTQFQCRPHGRKTTTKPLPGISPTLVADYLMDNMVAVSQADIRTDLRPYNEYPVGVEMDEELAHAYQGIIENVVTVVNNGGRVRTTTSRAVKNAIGVADMFLDQPYGLDTTRVDGEVIELSPEPIRPKEQKLIEICKDKKEKNEKMLIYVQWTGKLDIVNRLSKLLKDEGIRAIGFSSKVKINERQKWLEEQAKDGVDAVILNPELVGTGFNLLDYTTIIFYEIGNKLPIVRQAKDRSKRINQEHPVSVYFLYYKDTVQEDTLALISQKLKAAKAMEGDFTESALQDMGGDTDILTKLVSSIVKNEHIHVDEDNFEKTEVKSDEVNSVAEKRKKRSVIHFQPTSFLLAEPEEPQYISMCA